jgi:hypothetical protein
LTQRAPEFDDLRRRIVRGADKPDGTGIANRSDKIRRVATSGQRCLDQRMLQVQAFRQPYRNSHARLPIVDEISRRDVPSLYDVEGAGSVTGPA